jgi:hypothetical protein
MHFLETGKEGETPSSSADAQHLCDEISDRVSKQMVEISESLMLSLSELPTACTSAKTRF